VYTVSNYHQERMGMNHEHHFHYRDDAALPRRKLSVVIFLNAVITIAEYIGGVLSGSLALISDAGHNLSDVLSLILAYAGERVSAMRPGRRFSFGLKRFEVLIALINAISLLIIGMYIVYEAMQRYMHPPNIVPGIMIPVAIIGLLGNLISMLIISRGKNANLNMRAAFLHLLYDALSSVAVLVTGVLLLFVDLVVLDLVTSIVIVMMIVWSSLGVLQESLRIFLQGTPKGITADEVYRSILSVEGVGSVHGLHIWSVSSTEPFLSCHICVDRSTETVDTDHLIREVNALLQQRYGIAHTALQVENVEFCNANTCCR